VMILYPIFAKSRIVTCKDRPDQNRVNRFAWEFTHGKGREPGGRALDVRRALFPVLRRALDGGGEDLLHEGLVHLVHDALDGDMRGIGVGGVRHLGRWVEIQFKSPRRGGWSYRQDLLITYVMPFLGLRYSAHTRVIAGLEPRRRGTRLDYLVLE